ncbi:MAG: very short patch repair endonuclease [Nitrospinae bacterium]|nr:very short patch repair endonuclease [Nitrospinota bacterium]
MKKRRNAKLVSRIMASVKSAGTRPEIILRKGVWAKGLRYRLHDSRLPGKPDMVFTSARLAVFVDGDFWHGNQWRLRGFNSLEEQLKGLRNKPYWERKIKRNMERDRQVNHALRRGGWRVVRIWESQITKQPDRAINRIFNAVSRWKPQLIVQPK